MEQQLHTRPHQGMATVLMPYLKARHEPKRQPKAGRRPRIVALATHGAHDTSRIHPQPALIRLRAFFVGWRSARLVGLRLHQGLPCVGEAGLVRLGSSWFVVIQSGPIGDGVESTRGRVSMTPVAVILLWAVDVTTQIDMQVIKVMLSCTDNHNYNHNPSPSSIHACIARPREWSSTSKPP
jgi:hypothetical protein